MMRGSAIATGVALCLVLSSSALAATGEELYKTKGCAVCHTVDKKVVGPAYKDVAAKYKSDKGAEARLIQKVMKGGSGVWGTIPMPPNPVTEAEAKTLVEWVLSHK